MVNYRKAAGNAMTEPSQGEPFASGRGGGAATLARTTPDQLLTQVSQLQAQATQHVNNARTILGAKGQGAGFDIGTTTVGALILAVESQNEAFAYLADLIKQWAPTWSGDTPGGDKT